MTDYVLGFMFDPTGKTLLLVEKSSPEWQAGLLNGVGGQMEQPEMVMEAMVREFAEETGIQTTPEDWTKRLTLTTRDSMVFIYHAVGDIAKARKMSEKDTPFIVTVDRLPDNVIPNLRWIVPYLLEFAYTTGNVLYHWNESD